MENKKVISRETRPKFPKRAVITGGMPYGNKSLHFGHVGGVFVFADAFARFMRDRIGKDNVIFVSGTDCYGSPIAESYRKACLEGFSGTIEEFVRANHESQKAVLKAYGISLNMYGSSCFGRSGEIHKEVTDWFICRLYDNGHLRKNITAQFYDEKAGMFLNGRQVIGKCPVQSCNSEKGYADECDLGHQYAPKNLINPKSTLTGETPVMRDVANWYFNLPEKRDLLSEFAEELKNSDNIRPVVYKTIAEFLEPPMIHVMNDFMALYLSLKSKMAEHILIEEPKKTSFTLKFNTLNDCDTACELLTEKSARFRTGKTLVPFRLTGNIDWGVKAPIIEDMTELTVWVWPESLWAPISFTKAYLEETGEKCSEKCSDGGGTSVGSEKWRDYWYSEDSEIYQFIGQDNIYFYGVAEPAMFMALQGKESLASKPADGQMRMPTLVANHHVLFLDKKASSSGNVKPPMADELLNYYTAEQLRMHFLGLGLGMRSVSFQPKPLNPAAKPEEQDPVLKEGFLLSNVFNRVIRTAFYDCQKYFNGKMPLGEVDGAFLADAERAILEYERFMYRFEFHQVTYVLDSYIRKASKYMSKAKAEADKADDNDMRRNWLINIFHAIKTAALLLHPLAPNGTEMLREYLKLGDDFWCWESAFNTFADTLNGFDEHELKFLEPRVDFFKKHESQL
ncbi:MAG: class I tRNA ligase family protein [Oscillospiraceae bacterium]|nr:class I tRNA ligase family protein [Oscillospiraceae bacterium]